MIGDLKLSVSISLREMNIIFELLDYDGDGKVSRDELIEGFLAIKSPDS
jgi:Ca2+-binding EF-hand superfamily protein